jgi:RNA polymerase sigma-70 factor (ECF subfamily)
MDDLIGRWAAGDAAAAEELYLAYFSRVKEFIIKRGVHIVDAEDIAQEALIAGLEGLRAGRRPDRLTHWLLGIARHVSFGRKRPESDPALDLMEDPKRRSAGSMAVRREMHRLLAQTLEDLTPNDREIVDLLYRAGLSRKEIAERLGVSMEAIHTRCERAHSRLREALSRHFTEVALTRLEPPAPSMQDIRALRPAFRQVIAARHLLGLNDRDASQRLQLPESTLRARLASAYEMLHCDATADFSKARAEYEAEKDP